MTPLRIRVRNFRSFKKEQEFALPQEPGLYFMEGANESEPRLDANGAGKSSLWEALTWCRFGKTSRGLKAGDVSNWEAGKGTSVEVDWESPWGVVTEARTWGPISHRAKRQDGGAKEDLTKGDDFIREWLGLDFEPFLGCVFMAQGGRMFLDLKASEREGLFSKVMGLDAWIARSEEASRRAREDDDECRRLETLLARAEGALGAARGRGGDDREAEYERDRERRLGDIEYQVGEYENHDFTLGDLRAAEKREEAARAELRLALVAKDLQASLDLKTRGVEEVATRAAVLRDRVADADDQLRRAEAGEDCRACGQGLGSPAHLREARRRYEAEEAELDLVEANLARLRKERDEYAADLRKRRDAEDLVREALRDAEGRTKDARRARDASERHLRKLEEDHDAIKRERNPHRGEAARRSQELAALEREASGALRSLEDRRRLLATHAYWVRGFKEVRLGLIAEALTELEVEVNSSCEALGLVGWELRFRPDRETKSGGISRGFSVTVQSPDSPAEVPWEAWSGGESQRLRIAAQMGLADLIRLRTGATVPLEVWDEPTQGLSPQGVQDLLECLADRARRERRQIWLVDHRTYAFGGFAGGARVVKTPSGSRVRRSA